MKKIWIIPALTALIPVVAAVAQDKEKPKTIKEVMGKLHKGTKAQFSVLKTQLKEASPDWDEIQKTTKDFVILGADLEKNDPPKGSKEDWKKSADKYYANAKELDDAATAKDKNKLEATVKTVTGSCKSCHDTHKAAAKK